MGSNHTLSQCGQTFHLQLPAQIKMHASALEYLVHIQSVKAIILIEGLPETFCLYRRHLWRTERGSPLRMIGRLAHEVWLNNVALQTGTYFLTCWSNSAQNIGSGRNIFSTGIICLTSWMNFFCGFMSESWHFVPNVELKMAHSVGIFCIIQPMCRCCWTSLSQLICYCMLSTKFPGHFLKTGIDFPLSLTVQTPITLAMTLNSDETLR